MEIGYLLDRVRAGESVLGAKGIISVIVSYRISSPSIKFCFLCAGMLFSLKDAGTILFSLLSLTQC